MGLIFTKTFIKNNKFNVSSICGFQNIYELSLPESLICIEGIKEEEYLEDEENEGEIVENFQEGEEEILEEEYEDPYEFSVSPLKLDSSFTNESKKILNLTRFTISKNNYIKLSNYLKVFNLKRIILFNDNYNSGNKLYKNYLNLEEPNINKCCTG